MKILYSSLFFLFFIFNLTYSQILQSNSVIGMSLSGSINNTDMKSSSNNLDEISFSIIPKYGLFISKQILFGISVGYSYSWTNQLTINPLPWEYQIVNDKQTNSNVISPFIRHYKVLSNNFYIFFQTQIDAGYEYSRGKGYYGSYEDENYLIGVNFSPGLSYLVDNSFFVEAGFGNIGFTYRNGDSYKSNNFNLNFNMTNMNFGILLIL